MTLSIPEDLKVKIDQYPEINWSQVARIAFRKKIADLNLLNRLNELTSKSELTDEDAIRLGRKVNKALWKRYKEQLNGR
jgi:hypothetical protein